MVLEKGDKILFAHRRLFESDKPRFFIGEVDDVDSTGLIKVTGFSWVMDSFHGTCNRKKEKRTKILSLSSGTVLAYELPKNLSLVELEMVFDKNGLQLKNKSGFSMDLSEGNPRGSK